MSATSEPIEIDEGMDSHTDPTSPTNQTQPTDDGSSHIDAYSSSRALSSFTIRLKSPPVASNTLQSDSTTPSLHLLPCRIAHTGPANVPNYFRPTKAQAKAPTLTFGVDGAQLVQGDAEVYDARFRGRQISGTIVQLPEKSKGFIFEEDHNHAIEIDTDGVNDSDEYNNDDDTTMEKKESAAPQTIWKTSSTFSSWMLWQPDLESFERQHLKAAVHDWIQISHAVSHRWTSMMDLGGMGG